MLPTKRCLSSSSCCVQHRRKRSRIHRHSEIKDFSNDFDLPHCFLPTSLRIQVAALEQETLGLLFIPLLHFSVNYFLKKEKEQKKDKHRYLSLGPFLLWLTVGKHYGIVASFHSLCLVKFLAPDLLRTPQPWMFANRIHSAPRQQNTPELLHAIVWVVIVFHSPWCHTYDVV